MATQGKLWKSLTKEQWDDIDGCLAQEISLLRSQQEGWKESSSPWRRIENEIRVTQGILDALNDPDNCTTPEVAE